MKRFIVFMSLLVAVQPIGILQGYSDYCADLWHIPEDQQERIKAFDIPETHDAYCYIKCLLKSMRLFDDTDGFLFNDAVPSGEFLNKTLLDYMQECADKTPKMSDTCEWAYRGVSCALGSVSYLINTYNVTFEITLENENKL